VPHVSRKSATEKIFSPVFNFLLIPNFFKEAFASTCQWSGRPWLTPNIKIYSNYKNIIDSAHFKATLQLE